MQGPNVQEAERAGGRNDWHPIHVNKTFFHTLSPIAIG